MKILIIDDEPLIHISIEQLIHEYLETIEVYHAYDGFEMLALLEKHDFLLAYVDIKLPGMLGLDAIRQGKEVSPNTIYYIMTGFDKFEYAKEAIKLKVEDYLMKPLDYETIKSTIETSNTLQRSYKRERKSKFRSWLENILHNREYPLEFYNHYYRFSVLITMDKPDFSPDILAKNFMTYDDNMVSTLAGNHLLLLFFSESPDFLSSIKKHLSCEIFYSGITLFVSSIVNNDADYKDTLHHLLNHACLRVILGTNNCYSTKPLSNYNSELIEFCNICEEWKNAYFEKNYVTYMNLCDSLCNQFEENFLLKQFRNHILSFIQDVIDTKITPDVSTHTLRNILKNNISLIIQSSGNDRLVDSIIQYIQQNFCANISTTMLAEQFGLSSSYISNLLKQELGIRYNDYITKLRMDHAKQLLLSTNSSVKSITTACGYYSQSHFTKLFSEYESCTPLEYRKKHRNNLNNIEKPEV